MNVQSYVVREDTGGINFNLENFKLKDIGPEDVFITIECCGICASDLFYFKDGFILGHEIIGKIKLKGNQVKGFEIGQRVGVGWQKSSCQCCDDCIEGWGNYCNVKQSVISKEGGGYSTGITVPYQYVFAIPNQLPSERAAPLLCGGATVYAGLEAAGVKCGMKVGIIGIGGLGHLAIQFARALGAEVIAITRSKFKEQECMGLGALRAITAENFAAEKGSFHALLFTSAGGSGFPWMDYIGLLRNRGTLCLVGFPSEAIVVHPSIVQGGKKVVGSMIASPAQIRQMLRIAAQHHIQAEVEVLPMTSIADGVKKVKNKQARYRVVLKNG